MLVMQLLCHKMKFFSKFVVFKMSTQFININFLRGGIHPFSPPLKPHIESFGPINLGLKGNYGVFKIKSVVPI